MEPRIMLQRVGNSEAERDELEIQRILRSIRVDKTCAACVDDTETIAIDTMLELYELLKGAWCAETCAPRLRAGWTAQNSTLGQCSVTAFLVQDIFGGQVYAMKTENGLHCYNVIQDYEIDFTCEQFGERAADLVYDLTVDEVQNRNADRHFGNGEKRFRYELLRERCEDLLCSGNWKPRD